LGRDPGNVGCGRQRDGRNREPRLLHLVRSLFRPGHDVGLRNVAFQFNVRWGNDGLGAIVGFGRDRNDGLAGKLWIGFRGLILLRAASIEWGKVFRGLVINDLSVVEDRIRYNLGLQREEAGECDEQGQGYDVAGDRLEKSRPGKAARHKYVRPERRRSRVEFESRQAARENQIVQVF